MAGFYREFAETVARLIDEEQKERKAAARARAASVGREEARVARQVAEGDGLNECERLRACGLITEAEYATRRARLLET